MLAGTVMMSNAIRQHQPSSQAQQQQSAQSIYAHPASLSSNMSTTTTTTILAASQQQQQPSSHYSSTQHYSSQIYSSQQQSQYHPQNPYDIKDTVYGSGGANGSKSYQHYNRVNHSQPIPVDLTEADHYSDGPSSAAGSGAIYRPMASRNSAHKLQQKGGNSNKMTRNVSGQIEVNVSGETKRRRERDRDRDVVKDKRDDDDDEPGDDENNLDEKKKIQVQIMPQDDNWGQNTTAMTGDLSGADFNDDIMTEDGRSSMRSSRHPPAASTQQWPGHKRRRGLVTRTIRFALNNARQIISLIIFLLSYLTPIVFVVLPRLELTTSSNGSECGHECEALLIGIAFKLFVLFVGYAAMYWIRAHRRHKLPSLFGLKTLIVLVLLLVTICFWLFYYVRFMRANVDDYFHVLQFTSSHVDVLLFLFVVGVFLVELRHVKPTFVVRVMRSPDGEQREYELGDMSIECAALFILNRYYMDFKAYNPWMENAYRRRHSQFMQFEQLEAKKRARALASASSIGSTKQHRSSKEATEETSDANNANNNFDTESIATTATRRGRNASNKPLDVQSITNIMGANLSVSERLFEETEHERRVKRKRARLVATTEEAFTHIRRIQARDLAAQNDEDAISAATGTETNSESSIGGGFRRPVINSVATAPSSLMDPFEAAQAVFTSIARDLRRYLRVTHQQPYFTRPQIISHLADCIAYDMSPKAFLQKFFAGECLLFNERALVNPFNQDKVLEYREELMKKQHKLQITDPSRAAAAAAASGLKSLDQTWILISDNSLGQGIDDNMMIVLKQSDVTLMCNFKRLPRFKLIEDVLDPKRNKFVLKLNSETTV